MARELPAHVVAERKRRAEWVALAEHELEETRKFRERLAKDGFVPPEAP